MQLSALVDCRSCHRPGILDGVMLIRYCGGPDAQALVMMLIWESRDRQDAAYPAPGKRVLGRLRPEDGSLQ